jgi:hypothetical protein
MKISNKLSLRDFVRQLPSSRNELSDYVLSHNKHVQKLVEKDESYKTALDEAVNETFDKYSKHLSGLTDKISKLGHGVGYTADAWLTTGDIWGTLGGKFLNFLAQIPEKAYSVVYGVRTGNYLDSAQNILEGILSYCPGLTFADQGLTRIVQKRMVTDALKTFEKKVGIYKPWTSKLADKLSGWYTGVKDRVKNVFTPEYEPELNPA